MEELTDRERRMADAIRAIVRKRQADGKVPYIAIATEVAAKLGLTIDEVSEVSRRLEGMGMIVRGRTLNYDYFKPRDYDKVGNTYQADNGFRREERRQEDI